MHISALSILLGLTVAVAGLGGGLTAAAADDPLPSEVHFNRDIRPILSNYCFACHGPDEGQRRDRSAVRRGGHRLRRTRSGVRAIVPGDLKDSELYRRITSDDPDEHMPPPDFAKHLNRPADRTAEAVDRRRGEVGAALESGPPAARRTVPPPVAEWKPRSPIDHFIHARLKDEGDRARGRGRPANAHPPAVFRSDRPAADAGGGRRVRADNSPDAYEKVVDRLLASEHFGERMAVWWLDLVRYADSIGYHSDNPRDVWMYRDWVIQSFNENMPFDQFTIEQLAGDLLPDPTNRTEDRLRLQPPAANHRGRRRAAEGVHGQVRGRPRAERLGGLDGRDDGLRRMPRPQVRPVHAEGLLQPGGVLRRHQRTGRRRARSRRRFPRPSSKRNSPPSIEQIAAAAKNR